ncbi:inositol monophosphatase family protein [Polymorphobacter fuscus]|uniref:Histidinol phosphate phosphatase n=1 Tax=Sandarakinorhabdus fusca TaxID=1439888 RepID=A0A7C9GNF9_9SPHN|nr:inositol monophosphatase family protein [Polymorphobacter fuscus]KAB7647428.1 inositol monophosphatase family protein [Polymorphobacter fuscus]MQT16677.1 histidinol phosphate phosphatase [Polymorphobacter fuscus]NJC09338.1 histidinol phosphatase-like enzyme (inositol monophosphatase family) [Polymorphobacter fuscus]
MTDDDIALAHELADAAGAAIRPWFRRPFLVETKEDFSPVTIADREAEAAIRALLAEHRAHDGVIGEEYGDDRPDADRVWVLDPIDGTRAFVAGRPLFGTLIALMEGGVPVLGVIDQCIIGDRWIGGTDHPTTLNGARVHARACDTLAAARLGSTSPFLFDPADLPRFAALRGQVADTLFGGDCHNYGLVAAGHLDLVVESWLKIHDWAALVPVVTGAGGVMTDWSGAPLRQGSDGRVIAAGDARVAEAVHDMLAR